MNFAFTPNGWEDYQFWNENDKKTRNKINDLLKDIARHGALTGLGKPEPLTGQLAGFCSRRINDKDRLVYKIDSNTIIILSCRYHYSNQ